MRVFTHIVLSSLLGTSPALAAGGADAQACGEGCTSYRTSRAAFEAVLDRQPRVLGIGEYHEVEGAPKVASAIKRFTKDLLPSLRGRATSLVVETWIVDSRCGAPAQQAVAEVKKVTRRPASTEDEVTTLLGAAHDLGIAPHILKLACPEYQSLLDPKGELDPEKTLGLVTTKMHAKADELLDDADDTDGGPKGAVVLYGGALHNDLYPDEDMKEFSFGPAFAERTSNRYVELDLCVPEYVADDPGLKAEPWFAAAMKLTSKGRVVLMNPRPGSYVLLFPRTVKSN